MTLIDWIPAASTTATLAIILWLFRQLIITRLRRSVAHEFDAKLESIRSELRGSEERLKADLRQKESELEALRSGAISALASRHVAVNKRRLEAIDQIWSAVIALAPAKRITQMMAEVNFEKAATKAQADSRFREVFDALGYKGDTKEFDIIVGEVARPFVSPMVWASYSAFHAIATVNVMRLHAIKSGIGPTDFADHESVQRLIKAVLPHQTEFLKQYGADGYPFLLNELEAKLLKELQLMLSDEEASKESIEQASKIVQLANALREQSDRPPNSGSVVQQAQSHAAS